MDALLRRPANPGSVALIAHVSLMIILLTSHYG